MNSRNFLLLAGIFVLIVFFSGCVSSSGTTNVQPADYPGLIIEKFISENPSIDAGESAETELIFQNVGDEAATDIEGSLIRKGAFAVDESLTPIQQIVADLPAPIELPPTDAFIWKITAPEVTQDRVEELQARVSYNYKTTSTATIHFVPRDIMREKNEAAFPLNPSSSLGPLDIQITADQPYTIKPSDNKAVVRLNIFITNVGPGRVESKTIPEGGQCTKELDCIGTITITGSGPACINATTNTIYNKTISGVRLREGSEAEISETAVFAIPNLKAATSCQLKATANYRYRTDSDILSMQIKAVK